MPLLRLLRGGRAPIAWLSTLLAVLWGGAEATIFFIVPDVLLSIVVLRRPRLAAWLCLATLAGALAGGLLMYLWGRHNLPAAEGLLLALPAIGGDMLAGVRTQLETTGVMALFVGPLTGTPYKIYAVFSPHAGVALPLFLVVSIPARLLRFVAVTLLVHLINRLLTPLLGQRQRLGLLLVVWCAFYAWYFHTFSSIPG